jgi:hypothetical protein
VRQVGPHLEEVRLRLAGVPAVRPAAQRGDVEAAVVVAELLLLLRREDRELRVGGRQRVEREVDPSPVGAPVGLRHEDEVRLQVAAELGEVRAHTLAHVQPGGVDAGLLEPGSVDGAVGPGGQAHEVHVRDEAPAGPGAERRRLSRLEPTAAAARLGLVEAEGEVEDPRHARGRSHEVGARPEAGARHVAPDPASRIHRRARHADGHLVGAPVDRHRAVRERRGRAAGQAGHVPTGAPGGDEPIEPR